MRVPFLDLKAHHQPLKKEILAKIDEVIESGAFAGGPFVADFEAEFADYCGVHFAVGVGSGTEALWLTLLGLGIGPGDEVITVPSSFIATAEAISGCGATPVFVDIDEQTYTLDPAQLEAAVTPRTKAVMPVHLFGQMADMDPIVAVASEHGLPVIEDACQAHGARYKGRKAGAIGTAGCFSFYPGKNLGAFGEAGAVVTRDAGLAERIQILRDHGQERKYHHSVLGWNSRMDGIQAAVLRVKLKNLDQRNELRRQHAKRYGVLLSGCEDVILPHAMEHGVHVYHQYAIRTAERDDLLRKLVGRGIGCGIHYPIPIHLQEAYAHLGIARGSFPVAERCAAEFLSLPMFPELTDSQIEIVTEAIRDLLGVSVICESARV